MVRFGSGRNKFVQLMIRSRNSSGRFVRSLLTLMLTLTDTVTQTSQSKLTLTLTLTVTDTATLSSETKVSEINHKETENSVLVLSV